VTLTNNDNVRSYWTPKQTCSEKPLHTQIPCTLMIFYLFETQFYDNGKDSTLSILNFLFILSNVTFPHTYIVAIIIYLIGLFCQWWVCKSKHTNELMLHGFWSLFIDFIVARTTLLLDLMQFDVFFTHESMGITLLVALIYLRITLCNPSLE
jgi:hypothetical protein